MASKKDNIGFLLHDVARLMRWEFERKAQSVGLTRSQWQAIVRLSREDGIQQKQLADLLEVTPITLSGLLDRMERDGWIERRDDPEDRRAKRIYLTPKIRQEGVIETLQDLGQEVRRTALAGFKQTEIKQLGQLLEHMRSNLCDKRTESDH